MPPSHRATDGRRARGETCTGTRGASVGNGSNAEANCAGPWSVFCASRLSAGFLLHKSPSCCRMLWSIGRRSDLGLWVEFAGVPRKHSRQGLYRIHHGGRRTAVDDHLLPRRLASPACWRWRRRISLGTPRLSGYRRALITGFTVLSTFPTVRVTSPSFQQPCAGAEQYFGEATSRVAAGVLVPLRAVPIGAVHGVARSVF
jgi:hypothetical protein